MRNIALLTGLAAMVFVSGCSLFGPPAEETLASLDQRPFVNQVAPAITNPKQQALVQYQALLKNQDQARQAGVMRQLADIQLDLAENEDAQAAEMEKIEEAEVVLKQSQQRYSKAIDYYQQLIKSELAGQSGPEVYYQLSKAYQLQGKPEKVLATLTSLIATHPNVENADEIHFRRGEILFELREYGDAELAYDKVIRAKKRSAFYAQSVYKRGWSLFKLSRFPEATDLFVELADQILPGKQAGNIEMAGLSRADQELLNDTFRAISLNFSYLNKNDEVGLYFQRIGGRSYEDQIYDRLAGLFYEKKRYNDAAETNMAYAERYPGNSRAAYFSVRAVESYTQGRFPVKTLEAKKSYVHLYRKYQSRWIFADVAEKEKANHYIDQYLSELPRHYHALGQKVDPARSKVKMSRAKTKKSRLQALENYKQAVEWYRVYLEVLPNSAKVPEVHFLMAEALFESARYPEAVKAYEHVAYNYKGYQKSAEAAYAALLAYEEHQKSLPPIIADKKASSKKQPPVDRTQSINWRKKNIASALHFADQFPGHKQVIPVLVKSTESLYQLQEFSQAIIVAQRILARQPAVKDKDKLVAWRIIAHSEYEQKNFAKAEEAYRNTLLLTGKKDKSRKNLNELLAASIYKQAEQSKAKGDLAGAVSHFNRVAIAVPTASISANATYDAAAALLVMGNWSEAAMALVAFRASYPKHPLQSEASRKLAVAYLESEQKRLAAIEFERLGKDKKANNNFRRGASLQSAELYAEVGDIKKSKAIYAGLIARYPTPLSDSIEWKQRLVELSVKQRNNKQANYWRREIIKADKQAGKQRTDRTRYLAASASLTFAEASFVSFSRIKLVKPLKKNLARKKSQMTKTTKQFEKVVDYGVLETTTAATYYSGEIYRLFSEALLESPRPKGLNQLEREQYDLLLEEQAFSFEEKAIDILSINSARTAEGIYDKWIRKSMWRLSNLLPARYAKYEQVEDYVQAIH